MEEFYSNICIGNRAVNNIPGTDCRYDVLFYKKVSPGQSVCYMKSIHVIILHSGQLIPYFRIIFSKKVNSVFDRVNCHTCYRFDVHFS